MTLSALVDVVPSWAGAYATAAYAYYLIKIPIRSDVEKRLILLLIMFTLFLTFRGIYWLTSNEFFHALTDIFASIFPLILLIFAEGILRRHIPQWIKIFATIATIYFISVSVALGFQLINTSLLLIYQVSVLVAIAYIVITRDKTSLSNTENHLLSLLGATSIIGIPLIITDFKTIIDLPLPRMGSIGAEVFVYAFVRNTLSIKELYVFARDLFLIVILGVIVGLCFWVISENKGMEQLFGFISVGIALSLLLNILERLINLLRASRALVFRRWISKAKVDSVESFIRSLRRYVALKKSIVLNEDELGEYDKKTLKAVFSTYGTLLSLTQLDELNKHHQEDKHSYGIEQLIELLKRNECSDVCMLKHNAMTLLLVNNPRVAGQPYWRDELIIIDKIAQALAKDQPLQPSGV